jgi:hypothetical protein
LAIISHPIAEQLQIPRREDKPHPGGAKVFDPVHFDLRHIDYMPQDGCVKRSKLKVEMLEMPALSQHSLKSGLDYDEI